MKEKNMHKEETQQAPKVQAVTKQSKEIQACFHCKKTGHLKKHCSIWKAKQRRQKPSTGEGVKAAIKERYIMEWHL